MHEPDAKPDKRSLPVTIVAWLFIAAGTVGIIYHFGDFGGAAGSSAGALWVLALRLIAIGGGVLLLRGKRWARWILMAWIAYHVYLSAFHSTFEFIIHLLSLGALAAILFRRRPG